jgi:hypothetical protein
MRRYKTPGAFRQTLTAPCTFSCQDYRTETGNFMAQEDEATRCESLLARRNGITIPLLGNVSIVIHSSQAFPRLYGTYPVFFLVIDGLR